MDNPIPVNSCTKKGLSSGDLGLTTSSASPGIDKTDNFCLNLGNPTSLDNVKKKVGQFPASGVEKPRKKEGCTDARTCYFVCKNGHVVRRDLRCHSRFITSCPYCGGLWRKLTVKKYRKIISRMQSPKFVTLTLRKGGRHRVETLSKLVHRCRKYIRRKGYRIKSFVSCLEPPNHVHCVWDSDYIPQHEFSEIWETVTGDSFVVWIERVDKHRWKRAAYYITKYITKIAERGARMGLRGVHVIGSWGLGNTRTVRMVCSECGGFFSRLFDTDGIKNLGDYYFVEVKCR